MRKLMILVFVVAQSLTGLAQAKSPECAGVDNWATAMAFVHLKNAGLTTNDELDLKLTRAVRLASEQIGPDLYRQIHHIAFARKAGGSIEVITSNNASSTECSMSGVQVFVVSKRLGDT